MRGLGLGGAIRLRLHRLARVEQPALRPIQLVVGLALVRLDARDRLPRLFLPRILGALLFLRGPAFGGDLLALPGDPLRRVVGGADLQVEADHGLLLPMLLALQRRRGGLGRGNPEVDGRELVAHAVDRRALLVGALAQFLDLALGRQDACRLGAHAALDDVGAAEDVALERDHGAGDLAGGGARRLEVRRHPGVRQHGPDHVRDRTGHRDDVGERRQA